MFSTYSVRLDHSTGQKLAALAEITHRTRASVIRWLINSAIPTLSLIDPHLNPLHINGEEPDRLLSSNCGDCAQCLSHQESSCPQRGTGGLKGRSENFMEDRGDSKGVQDVS